MTALLISAAVALLISLVATPLLITWLRANGIGQPIREDGPQGHFSKAGTPTMGGLAIMASALCGYLAAHVKTVFTERGLLAMLTIGGAALVGFADDWIKVRHQRSLGLNKRAKLAGQLFIAIAFATGCVYWLKVDTHLSFTRFDSLHISLSQVGWVVWAVLIMLGATNAVNLTDGLDGLAAGSSAKPRPSCSACSRTVRVAFSALSGG